MLIEKYDHAIKEVMDRVRETQWSQVEKAADLIVAAVKKEVGFIYTIPAISLTVSWWIGRVDWRFCEDLDIPLRLSVLQEQSSVRVLRITEKALQAMRYVHQRQRRGMF